jgi:hypothetical protein
LIIAVTSFLPGAFFRNGIKTIAPLSGMIVASTRSPTFKRARSMNAVSKVIPCELPILVIVFVMT